MRQVGYLQEAFPYLTPVISVHTITVVSLLDILLLASQEGLYSME
jgi:hypothetical protein